MWYPSYDYFTKNGTLTGVYAYANRAIAFGKMSLGDRIVAARRGAIKLHDEFRSEAIVPSDKAVSIAWQNAPFQGEGTAAWDLDDAAQKRAYERMLAPTAGSS
jgi:monoamine oxidase